MSCPRFKVCLQNTPGWRALGHERWHHGKKEVLQASDPIHVEISTGCVCSVMAYRPRDLFLCNGKSITDYKVCESMVASRLVSIHWVIDF
ncbi:hypothetical protein TNCV_4634211 [Trichonephila clavipes]|nr:hypothetical protein TNCV_4634211 [Trichonephila clavipes]